MSFGFDKVQAR